MKKNKFKKLIKKQIRIKAAEYICSLQEGHTKTKDLNSYKYQSYLSSDQLSIEHKKLLFQLRTRSTHTRANYKNKFKFDLSCPLCKDKTAEQTDAHLLACSAIDNMLEDKTELHQVIHDNIFHDLEDQIKVTDVYRQIFKLI